MSQPTIYGIRHHGPGSARSLLSALELAPPDLILIEGPPEGEDWLSLAADPAMQPPVAMLVYNPKNLKQASFFPFAEYSPEWQAILFGLRNKIPVRLMDLSIGIAFNLQPDDEAEALQLTLNLPESESPSALLTDDPFTEIARLAGYSDPERWWEAMFERNGPSKSGVPENVFEVVLELMRALREEKERSGAAESRETILREAQMRQTLRQAKKEGFQNIAVVCGAWHAPVLADTELVTTKADAALLRGLKKVKTQVTWIPWSFDRLSRQSGYGAGVVAPAWYRELWQAGVENAMQEPPAPHTVWFARAAQLLRERDMILSSAHVIEAVRLSEALAALRHTALPGIEELREAAITLLCEGSEKTYELIEQQLVIGDVLGAVPATAPLVPLRADFDAQVRSARLKLSTEKQALELDLREEAQVRKSQLLHRLRLLDLPWGASEAISGRKEGRFHENWTLKWLPDYEIRLIEAGTWGNTVAAAAARLTQRRLRQTEQLGLLVGLLDSVLKADLPAVLPALLQKLRDLSARASDSLALAETVLPLVEVLRYGHARQLDLPAIEQLLEQIIPRICIQLPGACVGINEEFAAEVRKLVLGVHRGIQLWRPEEFASAWQGALAHISEAGAPLLAGLSSRLLFEQKARTTAQTSDGMAYRLSPAQPAYEAAQWLEGFLHGSGLLLLHQPELWEILDRWVSGIAEPNFPELLPLLRRTFSNFTGPEREKMLDLARSGFVGGGKAGLEEEFWDSERAGMVAPLVRMLLG